MSEKYLNYQAVVGSVPVEVRYRPRELLTAAKALGERLVEPDDRPLLDILRFWSNVIDELVIDGRPVKTSMTDDQARDQADACLARIIELTERHFDTMVPAIPAVAEHVILTVNGLSECRCLEWADA